MDHQDFQSPQGRQLAYRYSPPSTDLTYVWLSGFKSDMTGTKVTVLEGWAKQQGHGFLAFDYSGHGVSGGRFEDGTVSAWREDALAAIETLTKGRLVLVGSSMGGWMALLAALAPSAKIVVVLTGATGYAIQSTYKLFQLGAAVFWYQRKDVSAF